MTYTFTVPGPLQAKQRPRVVWDKRLVRHVAYTPERTVAFQQKVAWMAKKAQVRLLEGPVSLTVTFYLHRPQRLKGDPGPLPCPKRPDLDNLVKAVKDGLTKIAWKDDAQVVRLEASKWYHELGGEVRAEIRLEEAMQ